MAKRLVQKPPSKSLGVFVLTFIVGLNLSKISAHPLGGSLLTFYPQLWTEGERNVFGVVKFGLSQQEPLQVESETTQLPETTMSENNLNDSSLVPNSKCRENVKVW